MKGWLLDTNTCIHFLNDTSESLVERLRRHQPSQIKLSVVTAAELFYGAEKSQRRKVNRRRVEDLLLHLEVIPFDAPAARTYADTRVALERLGRPIGAMDLLIASTALSRGLAVVTNDLREFRRVKGLDVEDWL